MMGWALVLLTGGAIGVVFDELMGYWGMLVWIPVCILLGYFSDAIIGWFR